MNHHPSYNSTGTVGPADYWPGLCKFTETERGVVPENGSNYPPGLTFVVRQAGTGVR